MSFDLKISIPDGSRAAKIIERVAAHDHVSPEQAAAILLEEAARSRDELSPGERMLGAFSSDEDSAVMDAAMLQVRTLRETDRLRDFGA